MKTTAKDMLLGVAIGDALGVPYEFNSREKMQAFPATDMTGDGTHHQPAGTWSDDSSLTFCLAEALLEPYSLVAVAQKFVNWRNMAYWTARHEVFDIGLTTTRAISRLESILAEKRFEALKLLKYEAEEYDNGNGSLMRILPLVFELFNKPLKTQWEIVWDNSALTHRHIRAGMSCMIYLKLAEYLINGTDKHTAYDRTRKDITTLWEELDFASKERTHFARVIQTDITTYVEDKILSGGYVIESLEASIWCLLKTGNYQDAVFRAINFGHDTDTTAAITGGLAGILYGTDQLPLFWLASLARMEDIVALGEKLSEKYGF